MGSVLGLDTSNYTTSAAIFRGAEGRNCGKLLKVPHRGLGLRQSDALFQHIKHLPELLSELEADQWLRNICAVGASVRPRETDGSYMPCFLAGASQGSVVAHTLGVPFYEVSHQQGHLAAAAWSAGAMELLDGPFLAWHLSGGTTELLYVQPGEWNVTTKRIGGSTDLSAGQLIDRTGLCLGCDFPAGKAVDELSCGVQETVAPFPVKLKGLEFSLSGIENQIHAKLNSGGSKETVAAFVLETIANVVVRATASALKQYGTLPILFGGGVASNRLLRSRAEQLGALFAQPAYSCDNAMGVAILTRRALMWKGNP